MLCDVIMILFIIIFTVTTRLLLYHLMCLYYYYNNNKKNNKNIILIIIMLHTFFHCILWGQIHLGIIYLYKVISMISCFHQMEEHVWENGRNTHIGTLDLWHHRIWSIICRWSLKIKICFTLVRKAWITKELVTFYSPERLIGGLFYLALFLEMNRSSYLPSSSNNMGPFDIWLSATQN